MHLNQPYQPRYKPKILLNYRHINEASKANLDAYKRIIKWQPFFEQVYMTRPGHPKARKVLKGDFLQNQETGAEKYHDPLREKGRFGCFLGHGGAPFTSLNY